LPKVIHIVTDDKFIESAFLQFNRILPDSNIFYLLVDEFDQELRYINDRSNFIQIKKEIKYLERFSFTDDSRDVFCFHGLDFYRSYILNNLPLGNKVVWFLWGSEVYSNHIITNQFSLYGFYTKLFFSDRIIMKLLKDRFRQLKYKINYGIDAPERLVYNAIRRSNYCAVLYAEEFQMVQNSVDCNLEYLKFTYYPIEMMLKDSEKRVSLNNILIGNSSSESNNHIDIFIRLKHLPIGSKKIVVPLSYGDISYRTRVLKLGKNVLGPNFHPMVDFMSLLDYNTELEQCGIVIMNHFRQQAVGNVMTMLWMGAKVYLDERNSLFHYLTRIGVKICSIDKDLNLQNSDVFELLSIEDQNRNRLILNEEIMQDSLELELKDSFKKIFDES